MTSWLPNILFIVDERCHAEQWVGGLNPVAPANLSNHVLIGARASAQERAQAPLLTSARDKVINGATDGDTGGTMGGEQA